MTARRAFWGVADQGLSSVTNLALSILAARELSPRGFGGFAVAMAAYLVALGVGRALCGEILAVRRGAAEACTGAAAVAGVAGGVLVAGAGLVVGGSTGGALAVIGLFLPGLLVQDAVRYVHVVAGRPARAFAVDAAWAALLAVAVVTLFAAGEPGLTEFLVAWAAAGVASAAVGLRWSGSPSWSGGVRWLREHAGLARRLTAEFLVTFGAWQVALFGVALVAGIDDLAALRAVQVLYGPLTVLLVGARMTAVPDAVRAVAASSDPGAMARRRSALLAVATGGIGTALVAVLAVLPGGIGTAVLGENWEPAARLVVPFGIFMVGEALVTPAIVGVRAIEAGAGVRPALVGMVARIGGAVGGAWVGDARTAAWWLAAAGVVTAGAWWASLHDVSSGRKMAARAPAVRGPSEPEVTVAR